MTVVAAALACAAVAKADAGEARVGFVGHGSVPAGGGATLEAQLGISDTLSAELSAGGGWRDRGVGFVAARMTAALDVLSWVPELSVGVGGAYADSDVSLRLLAGLRLRNFVSPEWSWTLGIDGERRGEAWLAVGLLGVWWQTL